MCVGGGRMRVVLISSPEPLMDFVEKVFRVRELHHVLYVINIYNGFTATKDLHILGVTF